jgi:hypothetical protein
MKKRIQTSIGFKIGATISVLAMLVIGAGNIRAQGFPVLLQITSPASGTVVNPGQTVTVAVSPTSGDTFTGVTLDGDFPFQDQVLTTPLYQFSIIIPSKISAGNHFLTASGARSGQQPGKSNPLILDVEPSASITKIFVRPVTIHFNSVGDRIPLSVAGTFDDGSTIVITKSSGTTYSSGDPTATAVSSTGIVTAVGFGKYGVSPVVVRYGNQTFAVQVSTQRLPLPGK